MGRPREFDEAEALDAAMQVFWLKGYVATSMTDLMEAMGLHKGSIYKAFGDKHQLFVAALRHYVQAGVADMRRAFEAAETPMDAVKAFLSVGLDDSVTGPVVRGCMTMNSAVELAPHDEDVRAMVVAFMQGAKRELARWIAAGQEAGEFRADRSPEQLAEYLLFLKAGLLTASKANLDDQDPFGAAELALSAII